jgi:hypothetical protein
MEEKIPVLIMSSITRHAAAFPAAWVYFRIH